LIRSDSAELGFAAYQVSESFGAEVISIYRCYSNLKANKSVQISAIETSEKNIGTLSSLGVPLNLLFSTADKGTSSKLLKLTTGKGFNVIFTDSVGYTDEQLIASLGRFVRIGQGSTPGGGQRQNMSITLIDFVSVASNRPSVIKK